MGKRGKLKGTLSGVLNPERVNSQEALDCREIKSERIKE